MKPHPFIIKALYRLDASGFFLNLHYLHKPQILSLFYFLTQPTDAQPSSLQKKCPEIFCKSEFAALPKNYFLKKACHTQKPTG